MEENIVAIEGIKHVVQISTYLGKSCEHCSTIVGLENFAESINHYIEAHGYSLLHVGGETSTGVDGEPWEGTTAVLGSENPPPSSASRS